MTAPSTFRTHCRAILAVATVFFVCLLGPAVHAQTISPVSIQAVSSSPPGELLGDAAIITPETLSEGVSLSGQWRFKPGDDFDWASPGLNDGDWGYMDVPGRWPKGGYPDSGQVAWYRMTLKIHSGITHDEQLSQLAVHLGQILSAYEFYAGGQLLGGAGSMPPLAKAEYDRERIISIPISAVGDDGSLVLALRVWGGSPRSIKAWSGGVVNGAFMLGEYRNLLLNGFYSEVPRMLFCALFLAFGLYHLYLYSRNRQLDTYLWFGLMAITISIYGLMLTQYKYQLGWSFVGMKKTELAMLYVFPALAIQMFWPLLGMTVGRALRAYQLSFVALSVLVIAIPGQTIHYVTLGPWQLWCLPLLLYMPWLLVGKTLAGNKEARPLALGVVIFVCTCVNDLLIDFTYLETNRLAPIGFVAILVSMAISLADRFTTMFGGLESEVAQRTVELREANEALAEAARVDHLTGLLNRRGFTEELELELGRELRTGRGFSVVLADVDNFKKFNDSNGHYCGDVVLKQVATLLSQRVRMMDCVARWGGEEFILLLPETGAEGAAIIAEKLREVIESLPLHFEGKRLGITMTFGVAAHRGDESIDMCIDRADTALYEGKAMGRNTVMIGGQKGLKLVK